MQFNDTAARRGLARAWTDLEIFRVRRDGSVVAAVDYEGTHVVPSVDVDWRRRYVMALRPEDGPLLRLRPYGTDEVVIRAPRPGDYICGARDPRHPERLQRWFLCGAAFDLLLRAVRASTAEERGQLLQELSLEPAGADCWTIAQVVLRDELQAAGVDERYCRVVAEAVSDRELARRWSWTLATPRRRALLGLRPWSLLAPAAALVPGGALALAAGTVPVRALVGLLVGVLALPVGWNILRALAERMPGGLRGARTSGVLVLQIGGWVALALGLGAFPIAAGGVGLPLGAMWAMCVIARTGSARDTGGADVYALVAFGPFAGVLTSFLLTGEVSGRAVVLSLPVGLAAAVLPLLADLGDHERRCHRWEFRAAVGMFSDRAVGVVACALLLLANLGAATASVWQTHSPVVAVVAYVLLSVVAAGAGEALWRPALTRQLGRAIAFSRLHVALVAVSIGVAVLLA